MLRGCGESPILLGLVLAAVVVATSAISGSRFGDGVSVELIAASCALLTIITSLSDMKMSVIISADGLSKFVDASVWNAHIASLIADREVYERTIAATAAAVAAARVGDLLLVRARCGVSLFIHTVGVVATARHDGGMQERVGGGCQTRSRV